MTCWRQGSLLQMPSLGRRFSEGCPIEWLLGPGPTMSKLGRKKQGVMQATENGSRPRRSHPTRGSLQVPPVGFSSFQSSKGSHCPSSTTQDWE